MRSMVAKYGSEKGKSIFYASINKGIAGSSKWHRIKHQREDTTTSMIARYIPAASWFEFKKKRKDAMQMGMSTFPRDGGSSIACKKEIDVSGIKMALAKIFGTFDLNKDYGEGGPGSGRYPKGSERDAMVQKLNRIVGRIVQAKTGKASRSYRNAAIALRARLAGKKPTAYGTVRDLYTNDFNYRPQFASQNSWFAYRHRIAEGGPGSGRYPAGSNANSDAGANRPGAGRMAHGLGSNRAEYSAKRDHATHVAILRNMLGLKQSPVMRMKLGQIKTLHHDLHQQAVTKGLMKDSHVKTEFSTWFDYQNVLVEAGNKNSGNWGHKGVPGHQGGSKPGAGSKMDAHEISLDMNNLSTEYARVWSNWKQEDSEKMLFICKDGRALEVTSGEKGAVGFGLKDIDAALKEHGMKWWDLKTVIHNHNKGEAPSAGDVKVFKAMMAAGFGGNSQIYTPKTGQIREVPSSGGENTWFDYKHAISEDGRTNLRVEGDAK